ncbi:DUF2797 domain-containing protein [Halorhabdus tiamatea]|uniref:DUF2797 domain-containing protein n=1 Tax=Halorhabdus tiamatea SARL4B TaxID=1033806 RepID=F7PH69_9EURY|nr:DUF2797 domain-containing protein [Halorhabdus tiamatea]CCQ32486.1 conserved hypothetical protein (DUF2797) [Halorhabdus tiamatea SARL4B]
MQIVGYRPRVDEPARLLVSHDGDIQAEPLEPGVELTYTLEDRHCAGTIDDGTHISCDEPTAPYCSTHTDRWPCARCQGECDLPLASCREEHAIYLAAFAPAEFKVGVTRSWRLDTRLREQGADLAAHIRIVENGRIARQIEADIATSIGDSVRVDRKRRGLHRTVDTDAWETLLDDFEVLDRFDFEYGLDLADRPVPETLLSGTVRGTKGRMLVVERNKTAYGVDMRDLVGYEISQRETDRNLQASLGSFD